MNAMILIILTFSVCALGQTAGTYDLSQNNLHGIGRSADPRFVLDATVGQPVAGILSSSGGQSVRSGFWAFQQVAPTAANVSVSGRVTNENRAGIRNAVITIFSPTGESQSTTTGSFGYYRFDSVLSGQTYIVTAVSGRYTILDPIQTIGVLDQVTDLDFIGHPR